MGIVAPGTEVVRSFTFALPEKVVDWQGEQAIYRLRVQRQPGAQERTLTLRVRPPAGTELQESAPGAQMDAGWLVYRGPLDRDQEYEFQFGRSQ